MKKFLISDIYLYLVVILIITFLKSCLISPGLYETFFAYSYDVLALFGFTREMVYENLIWLIPIFTTIFFVSKRMFFKLINFDVRYGNRKRYVKECFIDNLIYTVFICFTSYLLQVFLIFILDGMPNIDFNFSFLIIGVKYVLGALFNSLLISMIALKVGNYVYSYSFVIIIDLLFTFFFKNSYVPLVSLYVNYSINFYDFLFSFVCLVVIATVYLKMDLLGGIDK